MKKSLLLILAMAAAIPAQAVVTLNSSNFGNGLVTTNNAALSSGALRFGVFPAIFDFAANSSNLSALEAAFTEVYAYSGPINALSVDGFYEISRPIDNTASFEGQSYASTIAGRSVFLWVQNSGATEHAIFSSSVTWNSGVGLPPFEVNYSPDVGVPGLTAHVGQLAVGPDLGAGAASHRLAVVIPEPSTALAAALGGWFMLVRRRR
jgi:hypothetical protein